MSEKQAALLVIDVQRGMFETGDQPPIHDAEGFLARVGGAIAKARAADVPVFFVRHDGGPGDPLEAGTPGWEIHPAVAPRAGEPVVEKRTPDSFHETNLQDLLAERGIGRLVLAGAQTDYCIDTTCRRAGSLGYPVLLLADAHSTFDNGVLTAEQIIRHHNRTLAGGFARLTTVAELSFGG